MTLPVFETLLVRLHGAVAQIALNRPDKANAMNWAMWQDIRSAMQWADRTPEVRAVVLKGEGTHFTAGIDLGMMAGLQGQIQDDCEARLREKLRGLILELQDTLSSLERCRKPVLAAVHGACLGGGIDLICCADMRYCSAEAEFAIKEIDIGMVADVGTLQRLPKLIGSQGLVRELAFTGRKVGAQEALALGLVNRVFETPSELEAGVLDLAQQIASKSPLAVRGTKQALNYARDHSVADGLEQIASWNAAMLLSEDLMAAMMSGKGAPPKFRD
ncbi:enoyl-CoA hydratase [Inhella inkyongensis]|uniref:Enoyl-CoA hydratase n=1 Tax=Inhella inkyongensis TaxID=392593 RepID=A0A840S577_9BURK|nr:crotonase/enoyl-CoA hydratase family protein [Inhella inkyongensis]MBB5205545.1 enoyl-CoA hydratase [Inhella inkyongensis]